MLVYCPWMILVVFDQNFEIDGKNCTFGLELLICSYTLATKLIFFNHVLQNHILCEAFGSLTTYATPELDLVRRLH